MDESLRPDKSWVKNAGRIFEPAGRFLGTYKIQTIGAGILLLMTVNLVSVTARKSITNDESVIIPAAYYHLVTNDLQLIREHPPLSKLLAGLPLLVIQPNELPPPNFGPLVTQDERELTYITRFWQDNRQQFETISFWARIPMIGLTLLLGVLIFYFTRDLFGARAALMALAMFALEPTTLGHARVVQTDIPATFGFLLSAFALNRYLRQPDWKLAGGVGLAAGVAILGKYSMVIVGPILLVVFLLLLWRRRSPRQALARHALVAAVTSVVVVNAGYFFYGGPVTDADAQWIAASFPSAGNSVLRTVRALKIILPTDFVMGVFWQLQHSRNGHPAGLLGMHSQHGWWYYFPVAFALKTTIPFLLLSLSSIGWALHRLLSRREWRLLILVVPLLVYTLFVMLSPINIGIRYYLPAYSFLFILSGGLLDGLLRRHRSGRMHMVGILIVVIAFSWMCVETARSYPNYIPYMNQLALSRPHWWYLSDSNVEWGDDVKELAAYLQARGETRAQVALLGAFPTLDFYGVQSENAITPVGSSPRYTALGASFLNGSTVPFYEVNGTRVSDETRVNTFAAFRRRTPETIIGNSIYVYRVHE